MLRSVLGYVMFVGLPGLALAFILRQGESLHAAPAVHGRWAVHLDAATAQGTCVAQLLTGVDSALLLRQSGMLLEGSLGERGDVVIAGSVSSDALELRGRINSTVATRHSACTAGDSLRFVATFDRSGPEWTMTGTGSEAQCRTCASVPFVGKRAAPAKGATDA